MESYAMEMLVVSINTLMLLLYWVMNKQKINDVRWGLKYK